jgi:hypothetical protein
MYSWQYLNNNFILFISDFLIYILTLQNNLKQHRLNNFIGSLLQHQNLNSTKFMSKWIEAKNKSV